MPHAAADHFYSDPVVYDILHAAGTADDVDGLEHIASRFCPKALRHGATWLEPACGTARHLRLLTKRGKRVAGFDAEPAMVEYAQRSLGPRVFLARLDDFLSAKPRLRVDLAFNLINTIRHARSDAEVLRHFDMIARSLRPGGVYIVGISLSMYGFESPTEDVWTGTRGRVKVTQVVQYLPPEGPGAGKGVRGRDERVINHVTVQRGKATFDVDSTYSLRTYSLKQWNALIARSQLRIVGVVDQDGEKVEACGLGYFVFILMPKGAKDDGQRIV
jgi:SAM-dependent methyltransferase